MNEIEDKSNERMSKNKNISNGRVYTILGVVVAIVVLVSIVFMNRPAVRQKPDSFVCGHNLSGLGKAIYMYQSDYDGEYPTADKWCDLLMSFSEVKPKQFICRGSDAKIGKSNYAFNKSVAGKKSSEIPSDIVILFETKGGWNQVGGSEMLTTDNHKGKGCNVLFNDLHVEFVKAERLGGLKWDTEKQDSESIE